MNMNCIFSKYEYAARALRLMESAGHEAYLVGGCVRDILMACRNSRKLSDVTINDIDITTDASPLEVKRIFSVAGCPVIETGIKHGTVTVLMPEPIEITTFRSECGYSDNRHPDRVTFVTSLEEDLKRRDFTINAAALDLRGRLIDPFSGLDDIRTGIIRAVGDAPQRFEEDALRIMRALRFSAVLGFTIEEATSHALHENRLLLNNVASERLLSEFRKLVMGKNAGEIIREYTDVIGVFIPELLPMKGFQQHNPYHRYDVLEHCIRAMEYIDIHAGSPEPHTDLSHMKIAALFHDIGKPLTYSMDEKGIGHFYSHPAQSSRLSREILTRLKADSFTTERVALLTKYHDLIFKRDTKLLKKWMNRFGAQVLFEILAIKLADNQATGNMSSELFEKFRDIEQMMHKILEDSQCFSLKDLAVSGRDILSLGIPSGPEIGQILNALLELVIEEKLPNEKDALLAEAAKKDLLSNALSD